MILVFVILMCGFKIADNSQDMFPLLGKIIYIDPGHGGRDPGAMYKDLKESDINLSISKILSETLERNGAIVYLTRYDDYDLSLKNDFRHKFSDLSKRVHMINSSNANLYLSIHLNSDTSNEWSGAQVFYDNGNSENKLIAGYIQNGLKNDLKMKRNIKEINDIYLNKNIQIPGVLIEVGFISNSNDRYLLRRSEYQQKISDSITKSLVNYFNM